MPVKIISDSTCDLSQELLRKYDIEIAPLTVTLGNRSGPDGAEITPEDIYRYVETSGQLPKTSAVNLMAYEALFRKWRKKGFEIIHFCISSEFSSSWQNACVAAQETGGVYPVDSRNLSTGQGLTVLKAAEMAMTGASVEEILRTCADMIPRVEASFVANSIDYLYKGGRCSALAALGANVFHIKPCIEVQDGTMVPRKKYRGSFQKVICAYVEDRLKGRTDIDLKRIFITHTRCREETVETVRRLIRQYQPGIEEILETTAGATITTHCGQETLGILFLRKM
jgi:DegV family protein with EDD domain